MKKSNNYFLLLLTSSVLIFLSSCNYGCIKTNLTHDEKDWFNVYLKSQIVVFESNLNRRDTFDITHIGESYSVCNRLELGEYQNHSLTLIMKPRKCRTQNGYCSIDMDFVKDVVNEACVKYFRVFDCAVGPREISKDKEKQIQLKDGSSINAVYFESNTGDSDYSDYSSDIESFYWSKKQGLVRYTTLHGETFDLVKYD